MKPGILATAVPLSVAESLNLCTSDQTVKPQTYVIKAIAVDDEPPALEIIKHFCEENDTVELQRTFTNPTEALKYLNRFPVDLLFLDINMPTLSGFRFFEKLPQTTMVVFTTAYSEHAVEGFNVGAIDYLLKPFTLERFQQAVGRATEYHQHTKQAAVGKQTTLYVRADYSLIKIDIADIAYVEGSEDYLKVHLQGQKPVVLRMTMKGMLDKLPPNDFLRVHRSFIVPVSRISNVRNKVIDLQGVKIPVGTKYGEDLYKVIRE
jgi:DNA-binding LytR/AlgR family response regulator